MVGRLSATWRHGRKPLRAFGLWLAIGWALVALVIYLSLTSHPIQTPGIEFGDKIGHFFAYFTLVFWFCQLYTARRHGAFFLLFVLMGVGLELIQGQTSYRTFQLADMAANTLGALGGWGLASLGGHGWLLRIERHLPRG